jgi:transposase
LSEHRDAVLTLIAHQPDLTLEEIRSALIERHGITVGQGTVSRFLKSHNITLKKTFAGLRPACGQRNGPAVGSDGGGERPTHFWWRMIP